MGHVYPVPASYNIYNIDPFVIMKAVALVILLVSKNLINLENGIVLGLLHKTLE